tara:strand:- start:5808 stop:7445 length:1638 start_codon:yes stop_codon:yes gene_type:complete
MPNQQGFVSAVYNAARAIGLPDTQARVAAAQAALETGYGRSVKGNNYFGIKAGSSWSGPTQNFKTWEDVGGKRVNITDKFRSYKSPKESLRDWASLMERRFPDVMKATTFKDAVSGLRAGKRGGYATDTKYNSKLGYIDKHFTSQAAKQIPGSVPAPTFKDASLLTSLSSPFSGSPTTLDVAGNASGTLYDVENASGKLLDVAGNPSGTLYDVKDQPPSMPARSQVDPRAFSAPVSRAPVAPVGAPQSTMPGRSQVTPSAPPTVEQQINAMTPAISMPNALPSFSPVPPSMPAAVPVSPPAPRIAPPTPVAQPPAPAMAPPPQHIAPQQMSRPAAPMAPPAPSFTGQDVWSGRATSGVATNGNAMSRNPDGTVSMTSSKYGYTETMNPDGSYRSSTAPGLFGIDAMASKAFGGIQGPLGPQKDQQQGIQPQAPRSTGSRIGSGVRGAAGGVAGGMIGGLLGPVGSLLGSYLGSQMAQGKNPLGGLLSQSPQQTFQRGYTPGLAFPDQPEGPTSQGELTGFGEAAARGEYGGQAQTAANNPGRGLY